MSALLLLIAFIIGAAILWYTNNLVDDLRREERTKVNIWANATKQTTDIEKERSKQLNDEVCNKMPSRCNGCLGGSEGNTKAQSIEFDEFCTNIIY